MNLSIGIVGLPNAGKSTLFNALLARQIANVAPYPFCTIEPNNGIVEVPDSRLAVLAEIVHTQQIVPAVVEFVDIAGLVAGAHKGEGLGNQFLAHIRECSALIHVVRGFRDENVVREGVIDPESDFETIKTELALADLQTLEKQKETNPSVATDQDRLRWLTITKLKTILDQDRDIRQASWSAEEHLIIRDLSLLTAKPALVVLNVNEADLTKDIKELVNNRELLLAEEVLTICAQTEMELAQLEPVDRHDYLLQLGIAKSGLERLITRGYELLNLQTFLTAGEKEVRAWTINKGMTAVQAAGVIHSDFEKNFIKAKIVDFADFLQYHGWKGAAEAGKVRLEGRDYHIKEGEIVEFVIN